MAVETHPKHSRGHHGKPPEKDSPFDQEVGRRNFLKTGAKIVGGAMVLGSAGFATSRFFQTSGESQPAAHPRGKTPKTSAATRPERTTTTVPEIDTPLEVLQRKVDFFLDPTKLTDEMIHAYVERGNRFQIDDNPFDDFGFDFPDVPGETTIYDDEIAYTLGGRLKREEHFSILYFNSGADSQVEFLSFLSGSANVRISESEDPNAFMRYGIAGSIFGQSTGVGRIVYPFIEAAFDWKDQRLADVPVFRDTLWISENISKNTLNYGNRTYRHLDSVAPTPEEFVQIYENQIGHPIIVHMGADPMTLWPELALSRVFPENNWMDPSFQPLFISGVREFLSGNTGALQSAIHNAASQGLIMDSSNPNLPSFIQDGKVTTIEEGLHKAPFGNTAFITGSEPFPELVAA